MTPIMPLVEFDSEAIAKTGIEGLDDTLCGGLLRNCLYLIEGLPGSGKTTLALQFLLEGVRRGEPVLLITLSETADELQMTALSHGWSLEGITIRELVPSEETLEPDGQYTMFHPSEVELGETTKAILMEVERIKPTRVVVDSLSEFRLMAGNSHRYRRQVLSLKHALRRRGCTVLLIDVTTASENHELRSLAHGVIHLEQMHPDYGAERRRLVIQKYRGVHYRGGYHDYRIAKGGLKVFPRLISTEYPQRHRGKALKSGIDELDALLGGGIDRGTSTLIVGAPGTGKSSLATQFVAQAASLGDRAAIFVFDESIRVMLSRVAGLGIDLQPHIDSGRVIIHELHPSQLSPGEFAQTIRRAVEDEGVSMVVIDSLNGYVNAMLEERFLASQFHELLMYLGQAGIATLVVGTHQGFIESDVVAPLDASYLADAVILMRHFEAGGEVHQAISVVKKRSGAHERTIRELRLQSAGVTVGPVLRNFRGVLTGVPVLEKAADHSNRGDLF